MTTNATKISNLVRRHHEAGLKRGGSRVQGMIRGQLRAMFKDLSPSARASALRTVDRLIYGDC